jgi:hypothetical protein
MEAPARCQASIGDIEDVLDMRWMYWLMELNPAFTDRLSLKEYFADALNSGAQ